MTLEELKRLKEVCALVTEFRADENTPWTKGIPRLTTFYSTFNPTQVAELLKWAEIGVRHEKWIHGKLGETPAADISPHEKLRRGEWPNGNSEGRKR